MSFDLEYCKKKFTDLSGNIVLSEISTSDDEMFSLTIRNLKGSKSEYDKIYYDDILPCYPILRTYAYEHDENRGDYFSIVAKKAQREKIIVVLIGIRYAEGPNRLNGCHNDIKNIYNFLNKYYENNEHFELDYLILADSDDPICGNITNLSPTRLNILNTLDVIKNNYEKFIVHYSGHGYFIPDYSNDETDGRDEIIVPYDYATEGIITDDQLNSHFLQKLDNNCSVKILMDCCNSGTLCDLKMYYNDTNIAINNSAPNVTASVIKLSGCKDDQFSYEDYVDGKYQGAFTNCLLQSLEQNSKTDLLTLVNDINSRLVSGGWGEQTSKLTSSYFIYNKDTFLGFEDISEGETLLSSSVQN